MTRADRDALSRPAVLAYWLAIVVGLVLYTTTRFDDRGAVVALWAGALGGTLLGQVLALRDYRFWIVALILIASGVYAGPMVPSGHAGTVLWQAFIPAVLCGYWSLGDRGTIAACWFPAVIWMLSILDRANGLLVPDGVGVTLLAGFAVVFLAILRAREARRSALWQHFAAVPLAAPVAAEVLREPAGRQLARAAWGTSVGMLTVAITVWLAPRLWHGEILTGQRVQVAASAHGAGLPCCPAGAEVDTELARVREYFDLGRGHDARTSPLRDGIDCHVCAAGVWSEVDAPPDTRADVSGTTASDEPPTTDAPVTAAASAGATPASAPTAVRASAPSASAAGSAPVQPAPSAPPLPSQATAASAPPLPSSARPAHPMAPVPPLPPQHAPPAQAADEHRSALPWLLALALGIAVCQVLLLALRPLRRLLTLRHLRRPFWDETVAQRVSNFWQLALIALRDAGWRPSPHEPPAALAHRVNSPDLARCATILDRARHGLGLDADDLTTMRDAATTTYATVRAPLSPLARAVGWLRWPLA